MSRGRLLIQDPEEYSRVSEAEYRAGDQAALMRMIVCCAFNKSALPDWAAKEIIDWGFAAQGDLFGSWDEVFGKPNGKPCPFKPGRRTAYQHKRHQEMFSDRIAWAVYEASKRGRPIDDTLFSEIGRKLGVGGKTTVKRLYALGRKHPYFALPDRENEG